MLCHWAVTTQEADVRLIRLLKKDLAQEIGGWVEKDLLSPEQARSICQEYDIDFDAARDDSGGYRLLVYLAYLFGGLALITILGANWELIPRGLRMGGLIALTAVFHIIGLFRYRADQQASATGFFLLGNLVYGASIILIAQIYHLGEHMPDGVFWWAIGSLPFGVLTRSAMLTLFSCALALVWFWIEFGMGYFPTLFPVFIVAGIYVLYHVKTSYLLFLTVVASIGLWLESLVTRGQGVNRYGFDISLEHFVVAVALTILGYALAEWMYKKGSVRSRDYATVLSLWSLRLGLLLMFVLSFSDPWREIMRDKWQYGQSMLMIIVPLLVLAVGFGFYAGRLRIVLPAVLLSSGVLAAVVFLGHRDHAVVYQIIVNLCLIITGILLIVRGTRSDTSHYYFMGVGTIVITALLRYFDLIGDFIGGAILFAVMAAIMLAAAKFWRARNDKEAAS